MQFERSENYVPYFFTSISEFRYIDAVRTTVRTTVLILFTSISELRYVDAVRTTVRTTVLILFTSTSELKYMDAVRNYFLQDNKITSTRALIFDLDSREVFSSFIFLTLHIFVDAISIVSSDYISNGTDS